MSTRCPRGRCEGAAFVAVFIFCRLVVGARAQEVNGFNGTTAGCSGPGPYPYLSQGYWPQDMPPPSDFGASYENASGPYVSFGFAAPYSPTNSRYFVTFGDALGDSCGGSAVSLKDASTCSNVDAAELASLPYSDWWGHLPNAVGIEDAVYPSLTANVQYGHWTAHSDGCASVYYAGGFMISDLVQCTASYGGGGSAVAVHDEGLGQVYVAGVMSVYNLAPLAPDGDESGGYQCSQWPVQFSVLINSGAAGVVDVPEITVSTLGATAVVDPVTGFLTMSITIMLAWQSTPLPDSYVMLGISFLGATALGGSIALPVAEQQGSEQELTLSGGVGTMKYILSYGFSTTGQPTVGYDGVYTFNMDQYICTEGVYCPMSGSALMNQTVRISTFGAGSEGGAVGVSSPREDMGLVAVVTCSAAGVLVAATVITAFVAMHRCENDMFRSRLYKKKKVAKKSSL